MKALVMKGAKDIQLQDISEHPIKDGNVEIEVYKSGICGADLLTWKEGPFFPDLIVGHEFSGRVINPGSRTNLAIGDRVTGLGYSYCKTCEKCRTGQPNLCLNAWNESSLGISNPGAMEEKISMRPDLVFKIPDEVSDLAAAVTEPAAVAYHAVKHVGIHPGLKVLIIGAGPIGILVAEFAKLEGADYVAVADLNTERAKLAVQLGSADEWFDASSEAAKKEIMERVQNVGYDIVIDAVGFSATMTDAIKYCKSGGIIGVTGNPVTEISFVFTYALLKEITYRPSIAYTPEEFHAVLKLEKDGRINLEKFVSNVIEPADAPAMFEELASGKSLNTKVLVAFKD